MKAISQLTLSVQLPDDETFSSFQSIANYSATEQLKSFIKASSNVAQPSHVNSFYLFGLSGVGKSHLLHASCTFAEKLGLSSVCLSFSELKELSVEVLDGLENIDLICLDDVQLIAGDKLWQQAVFDLFNRVIEQNKSLIVTGDQSVPQLKLGLADLVSRLFWE